MTKKLFKGYENPSSYAINVKTYCITISHPLTTTYATIFKYIFNRISLYVYLNSSTFRVNI